MLDAKCAAQQEVPLRRTLQLVSSWKSLSNALNDALTDATHVLNSTNNLVDRLASDNNDLDSAITMLIAIAAVEFTITFFVASGFATLYHIGDMP